MEDQKILKLIEQTTVSEKLLTAINYRDKIHVITILNVGTYIVEGLTWRDVINNQEIPCLRNGWADRVEITFAGREGGLCPYCPYSSDVRLDENVISGIYQVSEAE